MLFPSLVLADSITINCSQPLELEKEFVCNVSGNSDMGVSGLEAKLKVSPSLELISIITSDNWQGDGENGDIKLFTADTFKDTFNICQIKLKMKQNTGSIYLNPIIFYDGDVKAKAISAVSKQLTIQDSGKDTNSSNMVNGLVDAQNSKNETIDSISSKYLTNIKVNNYNLDFYKKSFEYDLVIGKERKLNILPVLEDTDAKYEIIGNNNLKDGSVIRIKVTSSANEIQDYIIKIKTLQVRKNYLWVFISIIVAIVLINAYRIVREVKKNEKNS